MLDYLGQRGRAKYILCSRSCYLDRCVKRESITYLLIRLHDCVDFNPVGVTLIFV